MRKFFLATAVVACSLFFTSCDDGNPHCWTITVKGSCSDGSGGNETLTLWGTADLINTYIDAIKQELKEYGCTASVSKKKNNKTEDECEEDYGW